MKLNSNQKIIMLGIILLILAGIIVVALKGMQVDLMMRQHKSIDIVIGKEFEIKDIQSICQEVFGKKQVILRKIEVFEDAVNINIDSITDEEKTELISKVNEKYGLSLVADEITVNTNANVRIRDMVKPYILPLAISVIIIYVYIGIRFRKLNVVKVLGGLSIVVLLTEAVITSIIAITRIPLSVNFINIMVVIAIVEMIVWIAKKEKELKNLSVQETKRKR